MLVRSCKKLLIDFKQNIEDFLCLKNQTNKTTTNNNKKQTHNLFILHTDQSKKKCCYVELLLGKSTKGKGSICHIHTFGVAQGRERTESIPATYEARRKKTTWLLHIVCQVNKEHNKILLWQTENWSLELGIIAVISHFYVWHCGNSQVNYTADSFETRASKLPKANAEPDEVLLQSHFSSWVAAPLPLEKCGSKAVS